MLYGVLPGLEEVSRLVLGTSGMRSRKESFALLDAFVSAGGNCLDTAYVYGGGLCEEVVGQWVASSGARHEMVFVVKGGHTPDCTPEGIRSQLLESLERLRIDCASIYMPHRDNLDIPVGEFVGVLNELRDQGLIGVFGVSNWTTDRIQAANEYARANHMSDIVAVSNNLSLAQMMDPVFPGSVSLDDASREWFSTSSMPLMPWSSQGRRFFTTPIDELDKDDQVARCWVSPANLERRRRATILARERGVETIEVALAYVVNQPYPTFPVIGPQTVAELRGSLRGLTVQLSPSDVRWLEYSELALADDYGPVDAIL